LKLYRQLSGASTEDSLALMQQAEEILLSEGWFLPMYEQQMYFVCGSDTTGITYSPYTGLVSFRNAAFVGE
jgi:ABC-type transport system substrate-binding protein